MFVRFACNWPPYKDGQHLEIPDHIGAHFIARGMAEEVTPADVRAYGQTIAAIDRAIAERIGETPASLSRSTRRRSRALSRRRSRAPSSTRLTECRRAAGSARSRGPNGDAS
jgi:hypothetical protein